MRLAAPVVFLFFATVLAATPADAQPTPPACDSPEARRYDFWIGEWDVENHNRDPAEFDGPLHPTGSATDRVHAILGGCAIVEHWEGALSWDHVLGFSVRAFDPERERWVAVLNWPSPAGAGFSVLEGTFEDGEGHLRAERTTPDGRPFRMWFRFADVAPDSFRWIGARSNDAGETWREFWTMEFRRRDPVSRAAVLNGPTRRIADRCSDERARALDFAIGDWAGEETIVGSDGREQTRPVAARVWSIMEGCAVMVFEGEGEGPVDDAFRVASYVPAEERWVAWSIRRDDPRFRRWEGPTDAGKDGSLTSTGRVGEEGTAADRRVRTTWTEFPDDRWRRETAVSSDGGATWRTVATAELERR